MTSVGDLTVTPLTTDVNDIETLHISCSGSVANIRIFNWKFVYYIETENVK